MRGSRGSFLFKSMNYGHSTDYTHLDAALRSRWESFLLLDVEMNTCVARPLTDVKAQREVAPFV